MSAFLCVCVCVVHLCVWIHPTWKAVKRGFLCSAVDPDVLCYWLLLLLVLIAQKRNLPAISVISKVYHFFFSFLLFCVLFNICFSFVFFCFVFISQLARWGSNLCIMDLCACLWCAFLVLQLSIKTCIPLNLRYLLWCFIPSSVSLVLLNVFVLGNGQYLELCLSFEYNSTHKKWEK